MELPNRGRDLTEFALKTANTNRPSLQASSPYISLLGLPKYHSLGGLSIRKLLSQSSGGWKPTIKVPAQLVSSEVSLFDLQMVALLLCLQMIFSPCMCLPVSLCVQMFSSYKHISQFSLGPTLNHLSKSPVFKCSRIWSSGG